MTVSSISHSVENHKKSKTAAYFIAFITLGMATASLGPTLPDLAEQTQTQLSQISFLFIARSLGYLLGSFAGGRFYDRWAGHAVMATMILVMAATLVLIPLMPLLILLTIVLFLLGLGEGTVDVGGNTLLVWVHRHKVSPFMNALHFFFGVGAFISPIIIAQVVLISGQITWAYWTLALLTMPVALWLLQLPSPAAPAPTTDDSSSQLNSLLVGLIAMFLLLYVGVEVTFGGWIFTYAVTLNLADETNAALLTSAFWGALTAGRLLSIPIASRIRPRSTLFSGLLGCAISISIILIWSNSLIAVWIGTLGAGLTMAPIFPVTLSFAERRMTITGKITGWFFVGASSGGMTIPWLVGQLFEPLGPHIMMIISLIILLLAMIILGTIIRVSAK